MTFTDDNLKRLKEDMLHPEEYGEGDSMVRVLSPIVARMEAAEEVVAVLDDIHYCFQNIWGLDRKAFENKFMPKMKEALDAWRKTAGK